MNSQLQGREFTIPENVINHIKAYISQEPNGSDGAIRAQNLLQTQTVNYGQLKRILHDMKYLDKVENPTQYNLYGGLPMEQWGWSILTTNRNSIEQNKNSQQSADNNSGINGMRANPHNKTHEKKDDKVLRPEFTKSNSDKTSVSTLMPSKVFEQIIHIKKLMK